MMYRSLLFGLMLVQTVCCARTNNTPHSAAGPEEQVPLQPSFTNGQTIIAKVNGIAILRSAVEEQMRAANQTPKAALKSLIQQELLSQEAYRRGFWHDAKVRREQERSLANTYIDREFGTRYTAKDIPPELIKEAYKLNEIRYQHPEMVKLSHIVVSAGSKDTDERHRQSAALAQRVRIIATSGKLSEAEFKDIAKFLAKENPLLTIKAESLTTPQRGFTVPEFADAAFALKDPGQISPVVQTKYGYHVIYFKDRIPAANIPFAQAEEEIRGRIFKQAREQSFLKWLDDLEKKYRVSIDTNMLTQLPSATAKAAP